MVLLFTNGFAQNPMERIKPKGMIKKNIPYCNDMASPKPPTINGITAPPAIPVQRMPDSEPWCSLTEFNANENMMEYITDMKNPTIGNAINAICAEPVSAKTRQTMVMDVAKINNFRLSINFNSNRPSKQPTVNMAQK